MADLLAVQSVRDMLSDLLAVQSVWGMLYLVTGLLAVQSVKGMQGFIYRGGRGWGVGEGSFTPNTPASPPNFRIYNQSILRVFSLSSYQ